MITVLRNVAEYGRGHKLAELQCVVIIVGSYARNETRSGSGDSI